MFENMCSSQVHTFMFFSSVCNSMLFRMLIHFLGQIPSNTFFAPPLRPSGMQNYAYCFYVFDIYFSAKSPALCFLHRLSAPQRRPLSKMIDSQRAEREGRYLILTWISPSRLKLVRLLLLGHIHCDSPHMSSEMLARIHTCHQRCLVPDESYTYPSAWSRAAVERRRSASQVHCPRTSSNKGCIRRIFNGP